MEEGGKGLRRYFKGGGVRTGGDRRERGEVKSTCWDLKGGVLR